MTENTPMGGEEEEKILRAINEVNDKKGIFSPGTYDEVITALYAQLNALQVRRTTSPPTETTPKEEIRQVTVMFMDVVGATRMEQILGSERWHRLIQDAHRRFAATVKQWDGEIGQYLGDGLLCYFGAQRSLGNDAARAAACALALQGQVAEYNFHVQETYREIREFAIRVGIATGQVVVGPVGSADRITMLAMGNATNRAARLQALVQGGSIAIDHETYLRVRNDFITLEQGEALIKGYTQPINYYLLTEPRASTQLLGDQIAGVTVPFVGRAGIQAQLRAKLNEAATGACRFVTVLGDIGMGKSRLLEEIAQSSAAKRFHIVRMAGHYERSGSAFSLVRDMLYTACDLAYVLTSQAAEDRIARYTREHWQSETNAAVAAAVVGFLGGYGFAESPYIRSMHHSTRGQDDTLLYRWVMTWLRGVAGGRPLLLLVDDLHWADTQSLSLLESFTCDTGGLLLLASARPSLKTNSPQFMRGQHSYTTYDLEPLSPDGTREIIGAVAQRVDNMPDDLETVIVDQAEGNPLFIEEFLRRLFDSGAFQWDEETGRWQVNTYAYRTLADQLPGGLVGVFQARLDDLKPTVRRVVQLAAIVGRTFWEGSVRALAGHDVAADFAELITRKIIVQRQMSRVADDIEYTFRNVLYYEVAYAMLPRSYRTLYHEQAAAWLAQRSTEQPEMLGLLAEQYTRAEKHLDALRTYAEAAAHQLERGQYTEALPLVETGLSSAREVPREDALPFVSRLWLVQAQIAHARRRYAEATADSQTALRLIGEIAGETMLDERVRASVTLGNAFTAMGSYDEALDVLTSAYNDTSHTNSPWLKSQVLRAFGMLRWSRGELNEAERYQQQAYITAKESSSDREIAASLAMMGRVALDKGAFATALDCFERVLATNRETGDLLYQISDLQLMALAHRLLFDVDTALEMLDEAEALAKRLNYPSPLLQADRALCYIAQKRPEEGLVLLRQASAERYLNTHERYAVQVAHMRGLALTGQYERCIELATPFLKAVQSHNRVLYGRGLLWYGLAQKQIGETLSLNTLTWALDNELTYGGRDLWLCYYALSLTHLDRADTVVYRMKAENTLKTIAASLVRRPRLAAIAGNLGHIRDMFSMWTKSKPTGDAGT